MPIALLIAAICTGLTTASVWILMDGTALGAVLLYILSGHIAMAGMAAGAVLRNPR